MHHSMKKSLVGLMLIMLGISIGWALSQWRSVDPGGAVAHVDSGGQGSGDQDSGDQGSGDQGSGDQGSGRRILYWYDPMSPTHRFDKPGKSPFMDMDLVPRYADEGAREGVGLSVSPQTVQSLGLRTARVVHETVASELNVVGNVVLNERDVAIVQTRASGFVERVHARAPGDVLVAGAPLADLLLPEWVAAQREFLAVRALGDESLTTAARQRLLLLGMPPTLVDEVQRTGEPKGSQTVTVPIGGLLVELLVRRGMTVAAGASLARVNGLDTVWIEAAVPEAQSGWLRLAQDARVRLAAFPGEVMTARIVSILPQADGATRTVRVRLELPNPGQRLKAGMSGQVTLSGGGRPALLVPSEAVIRTGKRALAYVVDGPGRFHPVEVHAGAEIGDRLVVLDGLEAGQEVVASAQFLIDSEASLRGVLAQSPLSPSSMAPPPDSGDRAHGHDAHAADTAAALTSHTVRGVIDEVSVEELMVAHEPVPALHWPAMTMAFRLADPALAAGLAPPQRVRFTFVVQGDDYVITAIERIEQ